MFGIHRIRRDMLFRSESRWRFPRSIWVKADLRRDPADVDVIIGTHRQCEIVADVVENFKRLETRLKLHFYLVESSGSLEHYCALPKGPGISRILILSDVPCTHSGPDHWIAPSQGAALAAQLGHHFGTGKMVFFSHSDMMGYRRDFLSYLVGKLEPTVPVASFTQRHIFPFSGGMIYRRDFFQTASVDWLPVEKNGYRIPGVERFPELERIQQWLDAGEQFVVEGIRRGGTSYIAASCGVKEDFFGHPLSVNYGLDQNDFGQFSEFRYGSIPYGREKFSERYPEFSNEENAMWRKSFDDEGNVIFLHAGRGVLSGNPKVKRGDFRSFIKDFNDRIGKNS